MPSAPDDAPLDVNSDLIPRLEAVLADYLAGESDFSLDLEDWNIRIRIKGPKWRGVVDKALATFVLDLDRKLTTELERLGIELPKTERGLVALRVDEGSTLAFLENVPETLEAIRKLPPQQQMLILVAVLIAAGAWAAVSIVRSYTERSKETEQTKRDADKEDQETKREQIRANERIATLEALTDGPTRYQLESPIRGLVKKMGKEDKIELPGGPEPVLKKQAKAALEKSTRSRTSNYYIDHPYTVEGITTKNPSRWSIALSYGQINFSAGLVLSKQDVQTLLADFNEAHDQNRRIAPNLQVTAEISAKGIRRAEVVGIGGRRDSAVKLSEALKAEGFDFP